MISVLPKLKLDTKLLQSRSLLQKPLNHFSSSVDTRKNLTSLALIF
jgi:hypothetical protein